MLEEVSVQSATASNVKLLVSLAAPPIVCFSGKVTVATLSSSSSQAVTAKAISRLMKNHPNVNLFFFILFYVFLFLVNYFFSKSVFTVSDTCMLPSRYSLLASSLLIHSMALAKVPTTLLPAMPGTYSVKYWKMNCSQVL
ncbi:unknown [Bacteroides stercoris CAG:120]|nr:unknown [Bacteroides stercoris CAG:120]